MNEHLSQASELKLSKNSPKSQVGSLPAQDCDSAKIKLDSCASCSLPSLRFHLAAYGFDNINDPFDLYQCTECGLTAVHPLLLPAELERFYDSDYYGGGVERKSKEKFTSWIESLVRIANRARGRKMLRYLPPSESFNTRKKILDVGCGRGNFLKAMASKGHICVGTDISEFEESGTQDFTYLRGSLESLKLASHEFDAASIWHVLEHTLNPSQELREISRVLKPGGILAVAVPNFGSWQSRFFGKHWFHLDLPRHLFHFNKKTLVKMLKMSGFEILEIGTFALDQNPFGWIQSAENRIFSNQFANGLYSCLKKSNRRPFAGYPSQYSAARSNGRGDLRERGMRALVYVLGVLLLIPALIETLVAALFGEGASLIIYARKNQKLKSSIV